MKNAILALLSIASVTGLATVASGNEYESHQAYVNETVKTKAEVAAATGVAKDGFDGSEATKMGGLHTLNAQSEVGWLNNQFHWNILRWIFLSALACAAMGLGFLLLALHFLLPA
jgi:hypothetical protein